MRHFGIFVVLVLLTCCSCQPNSCPPDRIIPNSKCGRGTGTGQCPAGATCIQGSKHRGYCCKVKDTSPPPDKTRYQSKLLPPVKGLCKSPLMHGGYLLTCTPGQAGRTCPTCFSCQPLLGTFLGLCCEDRTRSPCGYSLGMPPLPSVGKLETVSKEPIPAKEYTPHKDYAPSREYTPPKEYVPPKDIVKQDEYAPPNKYTSTKEYAQPKDYQPTNERPKEYAPSREYAPMNEYTLGKEYAQQKEYTPMKEYAPPKDYVPPKEYAPPKEYVPPKDYPHHKEYAPRPTKEYAHPKEYASPKEHAPPKEYAQHKEYTPPKEFAPPTEYAPPKKYAPPREYAPPKDNAPTKHISPKEYVAPRGYMPVKEYVQHKENVPPKEYTPLTEYTPPKKYEPPKEQAQPKKYIQSDKKDRHLPDSLVENLMGMYHDLSRDRKKSTSVMNKVHSEDKSFPHIPDTDKRRNKFNTQEEDYKLHDKTVMNSKNDYTDMQHNKIYEKHDTNPVNGEFSYKKPDIVEPINGYHDNSMKEDKIMKFHTKPDIKLTKPEIEKPLHPKPLDIPPKYAKVEHVYPETKFKQPTDSVPFKERKVKELKGNPKPDEFKSKDSKIIKITNMNPKMEKIVIVKHKISDNKQNDVKSKQMPVNKPHSIVVHEQAKKAESGILTKVIELPKRRDMESKSIIHIEMLTDQSKTDHGHKEVIDLAKPDASPAKYPENPTPSPVKPKEVIVKAAPVKINQPQPEITKRPPHETIVSHSNIASTQLVHSSEIVNGPEEVSYQQINISNGLVPATIPPNRIPNANPGTSDTEYITNPQEPNNAETNQNLLNRLGISDISPGNFQPLPTPSPPNPVTRRGQFTGNIGVGIVNAGDPCGGPPPVALCLGPDNTQCGLGYHCVPVSPRFGVCCANRQPPQPPQTNFSPITGRGATTARGGGPVTGGGVNYNPCGNSAPVSSCLGPMNLRCAPGSRCVQVDTVNGVCCIEGQQNNGVNNIQPRTIPGAVPSEDDPCGGGIQPESMCMGPMNIQCSAGRRCVQVDERFGVCCPPSTGAGMRNTALQQSNAMSARFSPPIRQQSWTPPLGRPGVSAFAQSRVPGIPGPIG